MMTKIILVRHAEAEGNINRRFCGWTDCDITKNGHNQAKYLGERFKDIHIDKLYSSSLKRAVQTAMYISKVKNLEINKTDMLKEIKGGDWEGEKWEDLPKKWPEIYKNWEYSPQNLEMPNGETIYEFRDRILSGIDSIIKENPGKTVCIVTHGAVIKLLTTIYMGKKIKEMVYTMWHDNTAISLIKYDKNGYTIEVEGDAAHLPDELSTIKNQEWFEDYKKKFDIK
jgi:broad specificity phosphatase PhoE